ncbi:Cullin-domain-containing protein [Hesseltinella vesiculosa]|uniref:Cullin-domain-containing protein n=1 Tax=Hesseltinella vesiculosa TaxID=101127 RepID=A0A1X2GV76_9FUNG|nr:Cullin-domain-containing protein [Hesseltinella vesiculosa]
MNNVRKSTTRIRPVKRVQNTDRGHDYDEGFQILRRAITEIFYKNAKSLSFELLYRTAYNLTLHQHGERLYEDVKSVIANYLESVAESTIVPAFVGTTTVTTSLHSMEGNADGGASFLKTVKLLWDDYTAAMTMISYALYYLDDKLPKYNLPRVTVMGLDLYRDKIIRSEKYPIQNHLITSMLNQIQLERHGDVIDRSAIKQAVSMLCELVDPTTKESVYVTDFETKYLETSTAFYQVESQTLTTNYDAPEFMRRVEKRLEEEEERTTHCLAMVSEPKIRNIVETQLIANNLTIVMEMPNTGLEHMLTSDKFEDLSRMYKLFSRVATGLTEMKSEISKYILHCGTEINRRVQADSGSTAPSDNKQRSTATAIRWVEQVLVLQAKFDRILDVAANKDKSFQTTFNEAFEQFINENAKSAEFISLYIDENLKKGLKGKTEDEVDDILDKTIMLFRFLRDKDVFERYYKQHLAKRLLFNRSVSDDAERGMLSKLKRECGYQFTNKLEGMFNDMRLSAEMNTNFKEYLDHSTKEYDLEPSVTVLTSTFWPMNLSGVPKCIMPPKVMDACRAFEQFYFARHSGRRLTWQCQMGTADVKAQFQSSKHILNVSTYAMLVLLLFNDAQDGLTAEHMLELTSIPKPDLHRTLQSLACAKYKILTKQSKGRDIAPEDVFKVNEGFTANLARIKIQSVASKVETDTERKHTQSKVDEERQHQIEAAIVRIMKDRKQMEHNLLIAEVTKQLSARFLPNPVMTKKRIEALIDREYLERSPDDRRAYRYLA